MYIKELLEQYEFHDSFIEDVIFENNRLELQIYLYNWKQTKKQEDEMKSIRLIFKEIRNFTFKGTEGTKESFEDDSILEFSYEEVMIIGELYYKVKLVLHQNVPGKMKIIEFITKEVEGIL